MNNISQIKQNFEKRYTLLVLGQPTNPYNDPHWLVDYEDLIDTTYLLWMAEYPRNTHLQGAEDFRSYILPYLLEPWHATLYDDIEQKHTLTPEGIHRWIHQ